jgi:hypothetical protein
MNSENTSPREVSSEFGKFYTRSEWREVLSTQYGLDCKFQTNERFESSRVDWQVGELKVLKAIVSEQTLTPENQRFKPELQDSLLVKLLLNGHTEIEGPGVRCHSLAANYWWLTHRSAFLKRR